MNTVIDLKAKVVLVTGASQGIGAQIVRTFHAAGASVALNHPSVGSTAADADAIAAELNATRPSRAIVVGADLADAQAVVAMMQTVQIRVI